MDIPFSGTIPRACLIAAVLTVLSGILPMDASISHAASPPFEAARHRGFPASPAGASEAERAAFFKKLVTEKPTGFGEPIGDRAFWRRIGANPAFSGIVPSGERALAEKLPELPDTLYLDFTKTGNRDRYQRPRDRRRSILSDLVLAECVEGGGRFLPKIEETVRAICAEKTWVLPAHDRDLANFNRTLVTVDLGSTMTALSLSQTDWLLSDRLSPATRSLIRERVDHFIFTPFMAMHRGEREPHWWMTERTNNWTSVCMSGVVSAACALIDSPDIRARYIEAAEKYAPYYIKSLSDDGNCSEGLGYWNYGYGYYIVLVEAVRKATNGAWDMMDDDKQRRTGAYPINIEIMPGVYPSFADCRSDARPGNLFLRYLNRRYGFGLDYLEKAPDLPGDLHMFSVFVLDDPYRERAVRTGNAHTLPLRSSFDDAGVFIVRSGKEHGLSAAFKGGHNGEEHNHNDLGSYVVALEGHATLLDPGGEVYTARTFSARRYDSNVLNSFGHPVPRPNGQLQKTGAQYTARILKKEFTDDTDTVVMDISGAYDMPSLTRLERTFVFSRKGGGSLTITDDAAFSEPGPFETALVTFDSWRAVDRNTIEAGEGASKVRVTIDTGGRPFTIESVSIDEDMQVKMKPVRLGIVLSEPVRKARVSVMITPAR